MKTQTKLFIALIAAMIVLLAIAWYTWPQETAPAQVVPATPAVTNSSTSTSATSTAATSTASTLIPVGSPYPTTVLGEQTSTLTIGGQTLYVALAENDAQQALGLGNRVGLGVHEGMLFIFPNDAQHEFWMKDMNFSIDMIWMSDDGTVIYIQPDVAPSTYPDAFGPSEVSRYVLEVPANFAAENGIVVGNKATLP